MLCTFNLHPPPPLLGLGPGSSGSSLRRHSLKAPPPPCFLLLHTHHTSSSSSTCFSVASSRSSSDSYYNFSSRSSDNGFAPQPAGAAAAGSSMPKVFIGHSFFKGKAALSMEPRAPEFLPLQSGAFKVSKEGSILLQFAPAVGSRQYDWSRKQVFSLSIVEIGTLISLGAKESCEFFHDPFKGRSDEGKVRKVLRVEPLPDGTGYFFNLSVSNKLLNVDDNIYIPISKAEFAVLVSASNFILPYLMGWHTFTDTIRPEESGRSVDMEQQPTADLEWGR